MKKTLKVGSVLFVIIVIAVLAFALTFDANNYKQNIIDQVEQKTGRDFSINGDIQLTIFPWIGLKVEKVTLGNAKGFSERPFASIAQLEVKVQLLPLLMMELRVDKLRFHGLSASLEMNAAGNNNWSDLIQATGSPNKTTKSTSATPVSDGAMLAGLFINGIEFVDAKVNWSDVQSGTNAKILDLKLKTSAIEFDEPVTIELGAGIVSNKPDVKAKVTLQGNIQFNQALNVFDIKDFQLSAITHMKELTQKPIVIKLKTNTHLDLKQGTAHGDTQVSSAGAAISSTFNITNLNTKPVVNGTLSSGVMNGRVLAEKLQIQLPPMASPQSLTKIAIRSSIQATPASMRLDDLNITLDGSQLSGWVYVSDMAQPKVSYKLKLNPIVLDGYLPPAVDAAMSDADITQAPSEKNTVMTDTQIPLPIDLLRTLDLDGTLDIERVSIKNRHINRITLPAKAANGIMIVNPVNMNIFDGTIRAKIGLDVRAVPAYIIDIKGSNLKAGMVMDPILAGILGNEKVTMQGTARFDVSVKANGNSVLALKKSAAGLVRMDVDRTTLNGVDVEYTVHSAVADYVQKKNIPFLENFRAEYVPQQKTAFDRLHASFTASQGKLLNKDLILESKRANVTGSGYIDMVGESIDFRPVLDIKVENPVSNTDKLKDMPMEFHIYGPFSGLKYEFNKEKYYKSVENLFKKEAREKIKKKVEIVKQEEKKKIEEKVKNKLKDLFKR